MNRFMLVPVMLLVLFGMGPRRLDASEKCYSVWYARAMEINANTGEYVIVDYYRWFRDGQPDAPI